MSVESTINYVKLALLAIIAILLFKLVMPKEGMVNPSPAALSAAPGASKGLTELDGNLVAQGFAEAPVYWPMADEAYLNKFLFGSDPASLNAAAKASTAAPILSRLATPGAYAALGDKGLSQNTDDLLVLMEMGGGQCKNGGWTADVSSCPGGAPAVEGFGLAPWMANK